MYKLFVSILLFATIVSSYSCKKEVEIAAPELSTNGICKISQTGATSGGTFTRAGDDSIIARGLCWSTNSSPVITDTRTIEGNGSDNFSSTVTGLNPDTKYYVRAYAITKAGTTYGNIIGFTTYLGKVTDWDGNVYNTVRIGTQIWMAENLKVTHYWNGDPISYLTDDAKWFDDTTGAYCNYENDGYKASIYGRLYNGFAVYNSHNVCPVGWHVPSDNDWTRLVNYLGSDSAGGKMKEGGTYHWYSPNTGATNESSFTALPGGNREEQGYGSLGSHAFWWTSTKEPNSMFPGIWSFEFRYLQYDNVYMSNGRGMNWGFSIRCIKD